MSLWRKTKPIRDVIVAAAFVFIVAQPWVSGTWRYYNADPGQWLEYGGALLVVGGWAGGSRLFGFLSQRVSNIAPLHLPFILLMGGSAVIGLPLMLFGDVIYAQGRFALQRPAMERVVAGDNACPALRCIRDAESGVTAFAWGANEHVWTGVCHDPQGVMAAARDAANEDRAAGRAPQARIFGGVSRWARPMSGPWIRCAVRDVETAPT